MSINQDFKTPRNLSPVSESNSKPRRWVLLAIFVLIAGVGLLLLSSGSTTKLEARETPVVAAVPPLPPAPVRNEVKDIVPSGATITALLGEYFNPQEIHKLNQRSRDIFPFTKICAGQPYQIITLDDKFNSFIYEIDDEELLVITRQSDHIEMERQPIIYEVKTSMVTGTISTSLFDAVHEIGEESVLAYALADIFAWDVNFILDIRKGDTFQAIVEKRFRDGKPAGYGDILAARFVNQKKVFNAIRYQDNEIRASFYNEKGENVRKAFLKAPLAFKRISSGFTMNRFHPILKSWKAHPAIDYVAPVGTPIKTVGDGRIHRIGFTKGNGNFIEVRHSNGYASLYLHMKGFARGLKRGSKITQGQVIGYLGGTGMATGPHLCFRMRLNGAPVNPTKLKVPAAKSVSKQNLAEFIALASPLLANLDGDNSNQMVAKAILPLPKTAASKLH